MMPLHEAPTCGAPQHAPIVCCHCGRPFPTDAPGTRHRNHCPYCLWSLHLDIVPGDRAADCHQPMEPVGVALRPDGEWLLVHRCQRCGAVRLNRIAGDDDERALLALALRPLRQLPFPLLV